MLTSLIPYEENGTHLEAFVAHQAGPKRPLILLCHAWNGRSDFICDKAREVAEWGYVGFAVDMYGRNVLGNNKEENAALKKPFVENRPWLQRRVLKAFEIACQLPQVDSSRVAALGFGFGGLCALDLARSGVKLKGAVSIYGHFESPPATCIKPIQAKILIHHGYNDPVSPLIELSRFEKEMEAAKVDWQAHIHGGTWHAFAAPGVHYPESGLLYNPVSAERAWESSRCFLKEVLT